MSLHFGLLARSPLRLPDYRRLWLGLVISRLGDMFTVIALLWFVLELTGSGTALSLLLLCFSLPALLTSPLLGWLLDHYQPRDIMLLDNLARALVIGAIPLLYWPGRSDVVGDVRAGARSWRPDARDVGGYSRDHAKAGAG